MAKAANSDIVNYIWTYLNQGYSLDSVKSALKNQGYSQKDINYAIDFIYANYYYSKDNSNNTYRKDTPNTTQLPDSKPHKAAMIAVLIGVISLLGVVAVVILALNTTNELPETIPDRSQINTDYFQDTTTIPEDTTEEVTKEPTIPEVEDTTTELEQPITTPERNFEEDISDKYDPSKTYTKRQISLKVEYFGETNPREAKKFCDLLNQDTEKSFCYKDIAITSENSAYCDFITTQQYKDNCFFEIVLENIDNSVCPKITNPNINKNCNEIIKMNDMAESYKNMEQPTTSELSAEEQAEIDQYYAVTANFYN